MSGHAPPSRSSRQNSHECNGERETAPEATERPKEASRLEAIASRLEPSAAVSGNFGASGAESIGAGGSFPQR